MADYSSYNYSNTSYLPVKHRTYATSNILRAAEKVGFV